MCVIKISICSTVDGTYYMALYLNLQFLKSVPLPPSLPPSLPLSVNLSVCLSLSPSLCVSIFLSLSLSWKIILHCVNFD